MTAEEFRNTIKNESYIGGGSPLHLEFHAFSQRAMKLTCEMNYNYHTPEELRSLMSKLTQSEIDETFGIFPPSNITPRTSSPYSRPTRSISSPWKNN